VEAAVSTGRDRRVHERRSTKIEVNLAGLQLAARTRDMSLGGIFVEWNDPLPPGSLLPVTLMLPDGPLELTAIVVRTVESVGMGMKFDTRSQRAKRRLEVFLVEARTGEEVS